MSGEQARNALAEALRLVEHGYSLTPVTLIRRPDGKKGASFHARGGWRHEDAWSTDPQQVRAWWTDHPDTSFAVGCAASGVEATDHDVKDGEDGTLWWSSQGLPWGDMLVETPSGGIHSYWRADPSRHLPDSARIAGPGVDSRSIGGDGSAGGLLYAPGAYILGEPGAYEIRGELVKAAELKLTPPEVLAAFPPREPKGYRADGEIVVKDRPVMIIKCREQIERLAALPPKTGGSTFRDAQMGAAMMLGRLAEADGSATHWHLAQLEAATVAVWGSVSAQDAANIESGLQDGLRKERWRWRAELPTVPLLASKGPVAALGPTEATAEQADAVAWPENLPGEPEGYDPIEAEARAEAVEVAAILRKRRLQRMADDIERPRLLRPFADYGTWDDDLASVPAPEMMVGQLVPERGVGFLGGPSGSYKSFVGVALAVGVAHGRSVMGERAFGVERGRKVLYVAAEGSEGVSLRVRAARHHGQVLQGRQLMVYRRAVDLTSEHDFADLRAFILAEGFEFLVVDTFRQTTLGVNENDNTEVGVVLGRLLGLRDEHGVGAMLIDHTNKTAQGLADLGGAGAKRANADYVLMIDLPNGDRGRDQQRMLRVAKLKDKADGRTWPIRLQAVPQIVDADGDASAVVAIGEVTPDAEAWQVAGLTWTDKRWALPADVEGLTGDGATAARDLARFMRVQAADPQGTGESRAEALRALQLASGRGGIGIYGKDTTTRRRGWSRLVELNRLQSTTKDLTVKSMWVAQASDPRPPQAENDAEQGDA